ncbi:MAG: DUF1566 domain-containing protein [Burkholderiales bacterium]|nr:DUF1566 domain-containing protein [Burkholderiales bacterium]
MKALMVAGIAFCIAGSASGALVPVNLDGDESTVVFLDQSTALYWTNAKSFDPAAAKHAPALLAVASASFEGLTNWRLPSYAEFGSLYQTLGSNGQGTMNLGPLTGPFGTYYWTSDLRDATTTYTWTPFGNARSFALNGSDQYIWAVSSVPEPSSVLLALCAAPLLAGLSMRRRRAKQSPRC